MPVGGYMFPRELSLFCVETGSDVGDTRPHCFIKFLISKIFWCMII